VLEAAQCRRELQRFLTLRESKSASHNAWSACLKERTDFGAAAHEITHTVDRVVTGDSFVAGLIYGLLKLKSARVQAGAHHKFRA
jgi:sugar/nucleoside kinase (ribokinase family)